MDANRRAKLVRRTIVGAGLAVFAALFVAAVVRSRSGVEIYAVTLAASALGVWELARMGARHGWRAGGPAAAALLMSAGCVVLALFREDPFPGGGELGALLTQTALVALAAAFVAVLTSRPSKQAGPRVSPAQRVLFALWIACPLLWGLYVWQLFGNGGFIALLILSKLGDIAGYYVGSLMGRSHPFPRLSPGKTTAGCVGSLIAGVVAGAVLAALGVLPVAATGTGGLLAGATFGALLNVAAQAGDLFESWVKRRSGVKDSGTLFGPSGGALDVVDSFLFTIPVALVTGPLLLA